MAGTSYRSVPFVQKLLLGFHRVLYRLTGGRLGGRFGQMPILLLTSTGSKSGQPRTTPLTYLADDGTYVLIASNNGKDWAPAWFGNLKAHPHATVQIRTRTIPVSAAVADPEQRARLWPVVLQRYPNYRGYEKKTTREIPLVVLQRRQ